MQKGLKSRTRERDDPLEVEIAAVAKEPLAELRIRWKKIFRSSPPAGFGRDLLARALSFRIQEYHHGGISAPIKQELQRLINLSLTSTEKKIPLRRRVQAGTVLLRQWKGQEYRVTVVEDGFSFKGNTYNNLSSIAREITGTRWNGPRFFGLRR